MDNKASLLKIFLVFSKIGAFTIGGGYAMIPLIEAEVVKRGWIEEKEFPDIVALSQSSPGILAVNMSIFTGHKLKGTKGSIAATLGTVLPSFIIILLIAMFMSNFQDNPVVVRIFNGIRPVVISLIAAPTINMARSSNGTWQAWALSISVMLMVAFLNISPIWILTVVIATAFSLTWIREKQKGRK